MSVTKMEIILDNPEGIYFSNRRQPSIVTGRVLISVGVQMYVKDVALYYKGKASVKWSVQSGSGKSKRSVTYRSRRGYGSNKICLFGGTKQKIMFPAGEYCFPFNILLPPGLPSSYEGLHGRVRYRLELVIDRHWWINDTHKTEITVISPLNLNDHPKSMVPVTRTTYHNYSGDEEKKSGAMSLEMSLPSTGYVPGDVIHVTVRVDNKSDVFINDVVVKLQVITTFHAENHTRNDKKRDRSTISSFSLGSVNRSENKTWSTPVALSRECPYHNLMDCSIIDVDYILSASAIASGTHHSVETTVPLLIGSVPVPVPVPGQGDTTSLRDLPPTYSDTVLDVLPPSYSDL